MAVWFGTQLYSGTDCPADAITPPAGLTELLDDCLAPGAAGISQVDRAAPARRRRPRSGWTGSSPFARTNVTQVLTLRPAAGVQASDRYASPPVDVGQLWSGRDARGERDTGLATTRCTSRPGWRPAGSTPACSTCTASPTSRAWWRSAPTDAEVLGRYRVAIPQQWDWEDIATGPCPTRQLRLRR